MWFRHRRRQAQLDLSALDRLAELVGRLVALLPEQSGAEQRQLPVPPPAAPLPGSAPAPVHPEPVLPPQPVAPLTQPSALYFVATSSGYRLREAGGVEAVPGVRVELAEGSFRVLRIGPSPLPGDDRRCAFLERDASAEARTPDR